MGSPSLLFPMTPVVRRPTVSTINTSTTMPKTLMMRLVGDDSLVVIVLSWS